MKLNTMISANFIIVYSDKKSTASIDDDKLRRIFTFDITKQFINNFHNLLVKKKFNYIERILRISNSSDRYRNLQESVFFSFFCIAQPL